uniref:Nucleoporin NUP42 n=1 Tax=Mola mola TaxID=94237 RepID=A0A3Q3VK36_MOLML
MPVCNFFLQGRCRYGEKCWNEHPRGGSRGGGGGGYNNSNNRPSAQQQHRGGGGVFGNRVWVNPSQQKGAYIQPSSFSSHDSDDWSQGRNTKASNFSFTPQNQFSALSSPTTFDRGGRGGGQSVSPRETIQMDMEIWESSGQWVFSCYSSFKTSLSGFTDHSPEEVRLEYYSSRASGDPQVYINGINQLLNQWRNRVQELKVMSPPTRAALLAELKNPAPQASAAGFGSSTSAAGFGSSMSSKGFGTAAPVQASTFSFTSAGGGFGSSAAPSSSTGFGSAPVVPTQPPSGFGSSATSSAVSPASFSFTAPTSNSSAATSGFGSASGFSFSSSAHTGGGGGAFASGFGGKVPAATGSSSIFGQASGFVTSSDTPAAAAAARSASSTSDSLFSPEDKLTPEELNQFKAKRFTLGQIPLKPPPADILVV